MVFSPKNPNQIFSVTEVHTDSKIIFTTDTMDRPPDVPPGTGRVGRPPSNGRGRGTGRRRGRPPGPGRGGGRIGQKRLRDDEEGVEVESRTVERVEEIEEERVDVDELEFEAEYASGEDGEEEEDEEEEAESSEEESDEEEEGGATNEDEDEDFAELTKFSRRPSRTTQAVEVSKWLET